MLFAQSVVPIFHSCLFGGMPQQVGSSVLVAFGPNALLFTAGHVFEWCEGGSRLLIPTRSGYLELPDAVFRSGAPSTDPKQDNLDFGHIYLNPDHVQALLANGFHATQLAGVTLHDAKDPARTYAFVGFPERMNNPRQSLFKSVVVTGPLLAPREYRKLKIDYVRHVAIRYTQQTFRHLDNANVTRFTPPKPDGMSGGGVWRLTSDATNHARVRGAQLAGIIIEHKRSGTVRALVACRVEFLAASVREAYPWTAPYQPTFRDHEITILRSG
ncbi:MAG: hypothetical protein U0V70_00160 [Terriglobia bacterium]